MQQIPAIGPVLIGVGSAVLREKAIRRSNIMIGLHCTAKALLIVVVDECGIDDKGRERKEYGIGD